MTEFKRVLWRSTVVVVSLSAALEAVAQQGSITFTPLSSLPAAPIPTLGGSALLLLAVLLAFMTWRHRQSAARGSLWGVSLLAGALLSAGSGVGLISSAVAVPGSEITDSDGPSTFELADATENVFANNSGISQRVSDLTLPGNCPSASIPVEGVDLACDLNAELVDGGSCSVDCRPDSVVVGSGQVLQVDGTAVDVEFVPCGEGTGSCTATVARQACEDIGMRVVSHASDGSDTVYSLGATDSCRWSISYYNSDQSLPEGACLAGVSNLDWSSGTCCAPGSWHGNTVPIPAPDTVFGFVDTGNSGYFSDLPNSSGAQWGCQNEGSPAGSASDCSSLYVACTTGTVVGEP